jgi:hypothetical protein
MQEFIKGMQNRLLYCLDLGLGIVKEYLILDDLVEIRVSQKSAILCVSVL